MEGNQRYQAHRFDNPSAIDQEMQAPDLQEDMTDGRDGSSFSSRRHNNSFHSSRPDNITPSDHFSFGDEDITSTQHNTGSDVEQLEGDKDVKEEDDTVTQSTGVGGGRSIGIAGSRRARTRWWPPQSDQHNVYPSLQQRRAELGQQIITLGHGQDSGRNRFALFQDRDNVPRLAFNVRVEGRSGLQWKGYPSPRDTFLPVGMSLSEILAQYPNHVWNDGLRLFMAEGWQAERMWHLLPSDARNAGASTRKWNYLQQALGREADKVGQEQFGEKRVPDKRVKKDEPDEDNDTDNTDVGDKSDNAAVSSGLVYPNTFVGGLQTSSQSFTTNSPRMITSYAPSGFPFTPSAQNIVVPGAVRSRGQAGSNASLATTRGRGPTGLAHPNPIN